MIVLDFSVKFRGSELYCACNILLKCVQMATQRELASSQGTGTSSALQRLEGFANRLFHRHSKGSSNELKVTLESDSSHVSELATLWDRSSKYIGIF